METESPPSNQFNYRVSNYAVQQPSSLIDKLKFMVGTSKTIDQPRLLTSDDELTTFSQIVQSSANDFSSFWLQNRSRFPRLFRIVQRVNIIPATSVPSESIFSMAGFISRKQRSIVN